MQELELKLLIDEAAAREIWNRALQVHLASVRPRARKIKSTYVDTPDHSLHRKGISLRLRRDGRRWLQTVKAGASLNGGISKVTEFETTAPDGRLEVAAISDEKLRNKVGRLVRGAPLIPVCETLVKRAEGEVRSESGTRALLAVDVVEIRADEQSGKLFELELEYQEGAPGGLFDIARILLPDGGVTFSRMSKAERGYLLAETGKVEPAPAPRTARTVSIARSGSAGRAAQKVLRECAGQIADNINATLQLPVSEGPHQLRIGLRRLRSALQVFRKAIACPAATYLGQEAKWLGQEVGKLRDLDVMLHDLVLPAAKACPFEPGFASLGGLLEDQAGRAREDLRETLRSNRVQVFLFNLMRFTETRGWRVRDKKNRSSRLAIPVGKLAAKALNKRWAKVRKRARNIQELSVEERHELRKELKSLRYAVEFMGPLYPVGKQKPFLKRLKKLQVLFGDLNDTAMVKSKLPEGTVAGTDTMDIQRAIGWILGASSTKAELGWTHAQDLWRSLNKTPVFWK